MELHIAFKKVIKEYGYGIISDGRLINILSDYQAYGYNRTIKLTVKEFVYNGYAEKILNAGKQKKSIFSIFTHSYTIVKPSDNKMRDTVSKCLSEFSSNCAYKEDVWITINSFLYGLGWKEDFNISQRDFLSPKKTANPVNTDVNTNVKIIRSQTKTTSLSPGKMDEWNSEYVVFNVVPTSAKIRIDGKNPIKNVDGKAFAELNYGSHIIEVSAPLYKTEQIIVDVVKGKKQTINLALKPNHGTLKIDCNDPYATIKVDGVVISGAVKLCVGKHNIEILSHDYFPYTSKIKIHDGEVLELPIELMPNFKILVVDCKDPDVDIIVDGSAKLSQTNNSMKLRQGKHKIICSKAGFKPYSTKVNIQIDGKTDPIIVTIPELHQNSGGIKVNIMPFGQKVSIDGVYVGETPYKSTEIPEGQHVIQVKGSVTRKFTVDIREGEFTIIK